MLDQDGLSDQTMRVKKYVERDMALDVSDIHR